MLHRVNVRPVYAYETVEGEVVTTRSTVAFRAVCSCGWRSSAKRSYKKAQVLKRLHLEAGG